MKRLAAILVLLIFAAPAHAWGTLEDFTSGWNHVDDGDKLDVYANALVDDLYISEGTGAHHTKSFGAEHFGDFSCRWYGQWDAAPSAWSSVCFGFADEVDYWPGVMDAGDSLWVRVSKGASDVVADIVSEDDGSGTDSDDITINTEDTNYYFQFSRSGTTATLTIWTGGYESSQVGTVNLTTTNTTFEYCHAYNVRNDDAGNVHWQVHDLDLSGAGEESHVGLLKQTLNNPVLHGATLSGGLYE